MPHMPHTSLLLSALTCGDFAQPERYFYQHPAIRPLLALCLTRGGTPQGPCGDYGAAPLPLDDRTLTRQPTSSHVPPALSNPHTHHIDSADALDGQTSAGRDCQDCCASSRGEYTMDGTYTSVMQALDEAQSSVADTFAASLCADGSDERNTVPKDPVPTGSSRVQEAGSRRCRQRSRTSVPALQPAATGIEASGSVSKMNCTRIDTGLNRQRSPSSADRLQALFRFVQTVAVSDLEQVSGARVQKKRARGRRARTRGGQGSESDLSKGDELDAAGSAGPRPRGNVEKSRCSSQQVSAASSSRRCTHGSCRKYASYGDPGRRVLLFCGRHKKAGNIDLKNRLCMFPEGCTARATYGTFLPRAADRAAGPELETSLPGVTGEGAGLDSTAGKGPDDYACAKEFDVKGGRSDGKFQGQAAAVAGVAEVGRGGGHVASDYSHQNVGQLARGVGISRMVEELGGPWGCGKGCQGLVGADEGTGRSQGTAAKLGLPPILQQSGRDEYEQAVGTLAAADASGGCRAQAASPEGLPVDSNLTCAEYLGVTGGDGEREVGTGDGARCDSRDTNERQARRGVRARGRAPAIDAAYCAAHRRPCDVQLYRRSLRPSLCCWLRAGEFYVLPLVEISIFLHALGLLLILSLSDFAKRRGAPSCRRSAV
jgi:hypothetical protein